MIDKDIEIDEPSYEDILSSCFTLKHELKRFKW